jgi:CBS domain containing-hemolysin-like protein
MEDFHTMAGFVFGLLGRAPEEGDEVSHDGLVFRVEETEGTRINRLAVKFVPEQLPAEEEQQAAEA